jgi:hypothetical protein
LPKIVTTLAGLAASPVKNKLERTKTVIKLLKKFGFEAEHPPADFSGVYAYTLVEYGVGKPQPILELFQQNEIQQAFRAALSRAILPSYSERDKILLRDMLWEIGLRNRD